jgi:hypothetical protein
VATLHAEYASHALLGLEYVKILSGWKQWTDGTIRREQATLLVDRMWHVWSTLTRTPSYQNEPRPFLYTKISGALLALVLDGYMTPGCEIGASVYGRCSHVSHLSSTLECAHRKINLTLVAPSPMMQQLLAPPGIADRVRIRARVYE